MPIDIRTPIQAPPREAATYPHVWIPAAQVLAPNPNAEPLARFSFLVYRDLPDGTREFAPAALQPAATRSAVEVRNLFTLCGLAALPDETPWPETAPFTRATCRAIAAAYQAQIAAYAAILHERGLI